MRKRRHAVIKSHSVDVPPDERSRFLQVARDPQVIPGVHHYCDEWCDHCPVTARCLAFRCTEIHRKSKGRAGSDPPFRSTEEMIEFTRALAAAEGTGTPELDQLLAEGAQGGGFRTSDPLAQTALEYALAVSMWLVLSPEELRSRRRGSSPGPEEVVLWFHLRIYLKLTRALVTRQRVLAGLSGLQEDADGCAKLTLVGVQRSRRALAQLLSPATSPTATSLLGLLDVIERGVDQRFPGARAFVRVGLDVPAG
jgi:hypothetical protein